MMSNSRVNAPPNTPAAAAKPTPSNSSTYRPSVPISVYRELASELQHKEEQLKALQVQNQQLLQHNQRLHQEVEKLGAWAQKVQQLTHAYDPHGRAKEQPSVVNATPPSLEPQPVATPEPPAVVPSPPTANTKNQNTSGESSRDVSAWLLGIAVALIILVCFGLGFLVMRPLFVEPNNSPELPQPEQDIENP
ncbi:MAG: hypothetical protein ACLFV6_00620 [Spirulinaceae cyanobacterium]